MVVDATVRMVLQHDTYSIFFCDNGSDVDFFIDGAGVLDLDEEEDRALDRQTKLDLCQHYLLFHLDRNGRDCRSLSRKLMSNNLRFIMDLVVELHLDEDKDDVEKGLRSTYRLLGRIISMLEQRDKARAHLKEIKKGRDAEEEQGPAPGVEGT